MLRSPGSACADSPQGLGLLLGSFGTLCVLIFGRPEAEAVRVWNLLVSEQ